MKLYFALLLSSLVISAITRAHIAIDLYTAVKNAKTGDKKKMYSKRNLRIGFISHVTHPLQVFLSLQKTRFLSDMRLYQNYLTKIRVTGLFAGRLLASSLATYSKEQIINNPDHTSLCSGFTIRNYNVLK